MRKLYELSPTTYNYTVQIKDTFVYHKANDSERIIAAMHFGGYPEYVRAITNALREGGVEAIV